MLCKQVSNQNYPTLQAVPFKLYAEESWTYFDGPCGWEKHFKKFSIFLVIFETFIKKLFWLGPIYDLFSTDIMLHQTLIMTMRDIKLGSSITWKLLREWKNLFIQLGNHSQPKVTENSHQIPTNISVEFFVSDFLIS